MNFIEKLTGISRKNKSLLCVGLDPDPQLMPDQLAVFDFNKAIIDATADLVCAYKPNFAFYEALGNEGLDALKRTVEYIPRAIPVIADAKRGDIGNTAKAYAEAIFSYYKFDAATVSPYLGFDSLEPFIQYHDKGIFILCRTSNPGALDFQSLICEIDNKKRPLFEIVALKASQWNTYGSSMSFNSYSKLSLMIAPVSTPQAANRSCCMRRADASGFSGSSRTISSPCGAATFD